MGSSLEQQCEDLRTDVKGTGDLVKALLQDDTFIGDADFPGQHGEMKTNIMLTYRHLEDARMRLGKVMQQIQGGVSKYDK